MKGDGEKGPDTRERLIQAAGEIFAHRGFTGATVREISRQANANIASVNYHFGDKGGLYSAVLEHTLSSVMKKYPPDLGVMPGSSAEERLHAFIRSFLLRILDESRPAWHGKLMAREIAEPTAALDHLIGKVIGPLYECLTSTVAELMGKAAEEQQVRLCAFSIMGQCLFYRHARYVILKLYPQKLDEGEIDRLSEHIMSFSLEGIKTLADERKILR